MKYLTLLLTVLFLAGCGGDGAAPSDGAGVAAASPVAGSAVNGPDTYDFEITGAGVTYSADIHVYPDVGWTGTQTEYDTVHYTIPDASAVPTIVTGKSLIANFTLNTGAGTLTIVMKKNGVAIQSQTITTNATGISMNN